MDEMRFTDSFAIWLKQRRRQLDLTQEQLADQVGCSVDTIKKYESGERQPSRGSASRLAVALQIPENLHADFSRFARSVHRAELGSSEQPVQAKELLPSIEEYQEPSSVSETSAPDSELSSHPSRWLFLGFGGLSVLAIIVILVVAAPTGRSLQDDARIQSNRGETTTAIETDQSVSPPPTVLRDLDIAQVKNLEQWPVLLAESFDNNTHNWGTGIKNDGSGILERTIVGGSYVLTLTTTTTYTVFLGGDSQISSPAIYYATVDVLKLQGNNDDGCVLFFDELSDSSHGVFRVRDALQIISVSSVIDNQTWTTHVNKTSAPSLRAGVVNQLGILANGEKLSFFVNGVRVAETSKSRPPGGRIDVGIAGTNIDQPVVCHFDNFIVRTPPL
jgi:transcriptional regulator with XRE-family HTH domain